MAVIKSLLKKSGMSSCKKVATHTKKEADTSTETKIEAATSTETKIEAATSTETKAVTFDHFH